MSMALDRGTLLPPALRAAVAGRGPVVIVGIHGMACPGCREYLDGLAAAGSAIAGWGGRVFVLLAGDGAAAASRALPGGLLPLAVADPGVRATAPFVAVTDEWGEVFFGARGSEDHDLPSPAELGEWVAFAAIQCPECENPEGGWRSL